MKHVYRSFIIHSFDEPKLGAYQCLHIQSSFDGEFGLVSLNTFVDLDSPEFRLISQFKETSGERPESLYAFRTHEIAYIFTHIVPLFNPLNLFKDEIPQESPAQNAQ